jgi:hypothetical protein
MKVVRESRLLAGLSDEEAEQVAALLEPRPAAMGEKSSANGSRETICISSNRDRRRW